MAEPVEPTGTPSAVRAAPDVVEVTVVLPCLNEALTLGDCIDRALETFAAHGIRGEVVVGDNGSTDGSQAIARQKGARVVDVPLRGYGAALLGGIAAARGRYVVMGDSDRSYDFGEVPRFLEKLRGGTQLVMGNRFRGEIKPGAMPPLHKYLGNPVLTKLGQVFFQAREIGDFHCGLRAFDKAAVDGLGLSCTGMEFASEMVVKAKLRGLSIAEVPVTLHKDGRDRPPHLRTWRDGWRHLRFLLLYSPRWLFLYPGLVLMALGAVIHALLLPGPFALGGDGGPVLDIHTLLYGGGLILVGAQAVFFAALSQVYAMSQGLVPETPRAKGLLNAITLEHGVVGGVLFVVTGVVLSGLAVSGWGRAGFGPTAPQDVMRLVVPAVVCLALGAQTIFSSFFLSLLGMGTRGSKPPGQDP
jgi:glycosyltransferase involved in cell wall biosynthesis